MTAIAKPVAGTIGRIEPRIEARIERWIRSSLRVVLGIPLDLKLLGANLIILSVAALALWTSFSVSTVRWTDLAILGAALAAGAGVNVALIRLALRPVKDLESVAKRVSEGRMNERVPQSLVADPGLAHLGRTMNDMLDTLAAGRERMRRIGADVVYAQERERAQVARELHDSVAQTLAAATFQIAAASHELGSDAENSRLVEARELLRTALEEIRNVARSLHPRVADDIGLPAALESLADSTRQRSLVDVYVRTDIADVVIPPPLATTLYRVAQEALRNVEKHADAATATVSLRARPGMVELEISDDGCGFEGPLEITTRDSSLRTIRERLSLAGGELHIDSTPEDGTRVVARARLETEAA